MATVRDSWGNPISAGAPYDASATRLSGTNLDPGGHVSVNHGRVVTGYNSTTTKEQLTGNYLNEHGRLGGTPADDGNAFPGELDKAVLTKIPIIPSDKAQPASRARARNDDWRVQISLPTNPGLFYHDQTNRIMGPLRETNGVIFPYIPRITIAHNANYETQALTHSNYPLHAYSSSQVSTITISGQFTAQTRQEADYVLAVIMFFRAATKMFWGNDEHAGQPPPILYLDGFGDNYFPHVPVVLKSFNNELPDDVDYIRTTDGTDRIASLSTMSISVEPIYSRSKVHNEFTLAAFARGTLIGGNGGFI